MSPLLAVSLFLLALLAGCSDDSTVAPGAAGPKGFILSENNAQRVTESGGKVNGSIEIIRKAGSGVTATPSGDLDLSFTKEDGTQWATEGADSFNITGFNAALLTFQRDPSNKWRFRLLGRGAGETEFRILFFRGNNLLYTSKAVPVRISTEGLEVTKLQIITDRADFINITDTAVGTIRGNLGNDSLSLTMEFFDAKGEPVEIWNDTTVTVTATVEQSDMAEFLVADVTPPSPYLKLRKIGDTKVSFTVKQNSPTYGNYTVFSTPPITLQVR